MSKKLIALASIFMVIIVVAVGISKLGRNEVVKEKEENHKIVTSFYPMYILAMNLTKDVKGVTVVNLTENQTGCLHDYQLTTQDMITLDSADLLVMNGGGMESFIENVVSSYPELTIVEASKGINMLPSESEHDHDHENEEHDHDHENEEHDHEEHEEGHHHDHGEYNAHVWMNIENYLVQIKNVYEALVEYDPENEAKYKANYEEYTNRVTKLKEEYVETLTDIANREVVIFHDAFAYMAQELGLDVVSTINLDGDSSLSAGEVSEIIDEVKHHKVKVLFTEEQYSDSIAKSVAKETEAKVYVIDSLVTGSRDYDSYLMGMRANLEVLKEALY